jgi:hypothetical protein
MEPRRETGRRYHGLDQTFAMALAASVLSAQTSKRASRPAPGEREAGRSTIQTRTRPIWFPAH